MNTAIFPAFIQKHYMIREWRHASAILSQDFPEEFSDIIDMLTLFRLKKEWIIAGGGGKSEVPSYMDNFLYGRGWEEKKFSTQILVDEKIMDSPTHKVDCYKNEIAVEIEWNNKDTFFDRDLNNFRLLFELRAISVGVIITRCDELQDLFDDLGKGEKYGPSTTHMRKLLPRIEGRSGGGCPLLVFGITKKIYEA